MAAEILKPAHALALQVQQRLEETYPSSQSPTVEQIQDMVEKVLIDTGHSAPPRSTSSTAPSAPACGR